MSTVGKIIPFSLLHIYGFILQAVDVHGYETIPRVATLLPAMIAAGWAHHILYFPQNVQKFPLCRTFLNSYAQVLC